MKKYFFNFSTGRAEKIVKLLEKTTVLSPKFEVAFEQWSIEYGNLSWQYFYVRRFADAEEAAKKVFLIIPQQNG